MQNLGPFTYQFVCSHVVFGLLAAWYVWPRLQRWDVWRAATVLTLPFTLRFVGSTTLAEGVVHGYDPTAAWIVTVGDTVSVALALLSLWLLRARRPAARVALWLLSIEDIGYSLVAIVVAGPDGMIDGIGAHWYVGTLYVPLMYVAQALLLVVLVARRGEWERPQGA